MSCLCRLRKAHTPESSGELLPVPDLILGHRVSCFLSLDIIYSRFVILQARKRKLRGVSWLHSQTELEQKDTPGLQTPAPKFFLCDSHPPRGMVGSRRVWKVKVLVTQSWLFVIPIVHQGPLSVEFSRQDYWSGLPCPSPGHLPDPGVKPVSPALQANSVPSKPLGKA